MCDFFKISDKDMLDSSKIKIITGIAGSAKSSNIDNFFKRNGVEYGRFTSTNKLKRDAFSRYGCYCDTIAGGLFTTDNGRFFVDQKECSFNNVVIDEILQTDTRVIEWIKDNAGKKNIVVTTDENQMLTKIGGEYLLAKFKELKQDPRSICRELSKTYRARDEKTEKYYYMLYKSVNEKENRFLLDNKLFPHIKYSELNFSHNDVYICHSNDLELELFRDNDLYHDYLADLLPKGSIARKGEIKDPYKYPIIPQAQVPHENVGYFQLANVGTATRYQGSEVDRSQKLYFLVRNGDFVGNREFYTVVTRAWTIDSIIIVDCENNEYLRPLTEFCGKPVKHTTWYTRLDDFKTSDGVALSSLVNNAPDRDVFLDDTDFYKLIEEIKDTPNEHYNLNAILFRDKVIRRKPPETQEDIPGNAPSMVRMLKKEPEFDYDYMPEFYRTFERVQKNRYPGAKCTIDYLQPATITVAERFANVPFPSVEDYENIKSRETFWYGVDFRASYPCILNNEKLPTGNAFYPRDPKLQDNEFHTEVDTGLVDWYINYSDVLTQGALCTGDLVRFCQEHYGMWTEFVYIGSSSCKVGSEMGKRLHDLAYRTKESKALIKYTHYGIADRPYLERVDFNDVGECEAYAVNEFQNHQLLMCAIRSYQCLNVLKLMYHIYGDLKHGSVNADCLYFDTRRKISVLGDELKALVPGYDFRIFRNKDRNRVLYRTYKPLPEQKSKKKNK